MLNMIKMDIYRMFKTKAMYIVWLFMVIAVVFTTSLLKQDYKDAEMQQESYEESLETQNVNVGMSVTLPTEPNTKVSLYDVAYANLQGKFVTLFIVIFAVIFATADINSGYIKNFGGQVRSRWMLILSKTAAIITYTILTLLLFLVVQGISNWVYFGYFKLGPAKQFVIYMAVQTILHCAFAVIITALAIIIHNNVFTMVLAVCMCMNMMVILYSSVDKWILAAGIKGFRMLEHTVTGKISMLAMDLTAKSAGNAIIVAAAFIIGASALGCLVFQKRDIQ